MKQEGKEATVTRAELAETIHARTTTLVKGHLTAPMISIDKTMALMIAGW
jgi:hypothetical protein